jgi:hypothetical protein
VSRSNAVPRGPAQVLGKARWAAIAVLAIGLIAGPATPSFGESAGPASAQIGRTSQPTFDAKYLNGVGGAKPARTVGLAGTWDFTPVTNTVCTGGGPFGTTSGPMTCVDSPASGKRTTVQVPGGGWLKQGYADLSTAIYSRTIRVPDLAADQITRLTFGAVNHQATLKVDGRTVATNMTSYTASTFDLTGFVRPGGTHRIEVTVKGRRALVGPDGRYLVPEGASWSDDVAQGIFRSADLEVFPAVSITDAVVRTSVSRRQLSYDVSIANRTSRPQRVTLSGALTSWNEELWNYPAIPRRDVTVPANTMTTVTVDALAWRAAPDSFWWPNVPYRKGYRAELHNLHLAVTTGDRHGQPSQYDVRFGFRELTQVGDHYELNGVRVNFRGDSLQGANYDNIDHHGRSDAYDTLPGFLKPSLDNGGWPEAVDNYERLNYNSVRIHQIPATPYMLDVADEMGLMIQDETAIRGSNNRENFDAGLDNMVNHLAALVQRDRNHASVLRWSQANEPQVQFFVNPGAGPAFDETLYQTVMRYDTTRPISTDGESPDLPHDNYTVFCHYHGFSFGKYDESVCDGPAGKPHGQGEFIWSADSTPQGLAWFGTATMRMREQGGSEARPYTLLSGWVSHIPGVKRTDMRLESGYPNGPHPIYGEDNLPDPWANPTIRLVQHSFNPVAVIDSAFWNANKLSNEAGAWPTTPAVITPGSTTRQLTVFNDSFSGERLTVSWSLRAGSASGRPVDRGSADWKVGLGGRQQYPITFTAPATGQPLYLDITVKKPGEGTLFHDASTVFQVQPAA